jgi:hypothetical protein
MFQQNAWAEVKDCKPFVEKKCGVCHFTNYICPGVEKKKGSWAWKRNVNSMVDMGMDATKDEVKQLVDCLVKADDDLLSICRKK